MKRRINPCQTYLVAWHDERIIKPGFSSERRWRSFTGELVAVADFGPKSTPAFALEIRLQRIAEDHGGNPAFEDKAAAVPYLGGHGGGYLECYYFAEEDYPVALSEMLRAFQETEE